MSTYAYSGCDQAGKNRRGWIEAGTPKRARLLLAAQGIWTESLKPAVHRGQGLESGLRERLYRDLGALIRAGLPLERSLNLLMEGAPDSLSLAAAAVRDRVREGGGVAGSFDAVCGPLPPYESAALTAAERSGELSSALETLGTVMERRRILRERLWTSLLYPLFLLGLGTALCALMLFVLAPRALRMMDTMGGTLPTGASAALTAARWVWLAGVVGLPLGLLALMRWRRSALRDPLRAKRHEQRLCAAGPPGRLFAALWSMRFASALGMLKRAGVPLVEALPIAGEASGSAWIRAETIEQAGRVRHGEPLSRSIEAIAPLRETLAEWVRLGEVTGDLDAMLDQAALRLQEVYERRLTRMLALLDPLLVLTIGLFVLAVALGVLLPVLDFARHVGDF